MKRYYLWLLAVLATATLLLGTGITVLAETDEDDVENLGRVTDLWWDGEMAAWEEVDDAYRYEVELYRSTTKKKTEKPKTAEFNFESAFTVTGNYRFRVRALGKKSSQKGEWSAYSGYYEVESDNLYKKPANASDGSAPVSGGPGSDGKTNPTASTTANTTANTSAGPESAQSMGEWQQTEAATWWFRYPDGTFPKNSWLKVKEVWYYFNESGVMMTGWITLSDGMYYLNIPDGGLLANTTTPDGYQVDASGRRINY